MFCRDDDKGYVILHNMQTFPFSFSTHDPCTFICFLNRPFNGNALSQAQHCKERFTKALQSPGIDKRID